VKISFFDIDSNEKKYFQKNLKLGSKANVSYFKKELTLRNYKDALDSEVIVVFVHSDLSKEVLEKLPKLKYIITMSTGFDHIDLEYCKKYGIKVSNVPRYGRNSVAEFSFALLLALSRRLDYAIDRAKEGNFSIQGLEGFDLKGKTLGVVGVGSIGENMIKIAKGFDMDIIAYSKNRDEKYAKRIGIKLVSFNELLRKSDIITFHVPLTNETKHMLNMKNIKLIKKGAYLINTSRGEVIDTKALLYALDKGLIAGAGLDVLEGEDDLKDERQLIKNHLKREEKKVLMENHQLLKKRNVIVTGHVAFYTKEAIERILACTVENIKNYLIGRASNLV